MNIFLFFVALFVSVLVVGRVIVVKESLLGTSLERICEDCREIANVPACSFMCNYNAINEPNEDLPTLNGIYLLKSHNVGDSGTVIRWVLELNLSTDGSITGFSSVRRQSNYQNFSVSGIYAGSATLLLLLSTAETTGEPLKVWDPTESEVLATSADPGATGLKLTIAEDSLLHGSTTGYTYVDRHAPIQLTFEKVDASAIPSDYLSA